MFSASGRFLAQAEEKLNISVEFFCELLWKTNIVNYIIINELRCAL